MLRPRVSNILRLCAVVSCFLLSVDVLPMLGQAPGGNEVQAEDVRAGPADAVDRGNEDAESHDDAAVVSASMRAADDFLGDVAWRLDRGLFVSQASWDRLWGHYSEVLDDKAATRRERARAALIQLQIRGWQADAEGVLSGADDFLAEYVEADFGNEQAVARLLRGEALQLEGRHYEALEEYAGLAGEYAGELVSVEMGFKSRLYYRLLDALTRLGSEPESDRILLGRFLLSIYPDPAYDGLVRRVGDCEGWPVLPTAEEVAAQWAPRTGAPGLRGLLPPAGVCDLDPCASGCLACDDADLCSNGPVVQGGKQGGAECPVDSVVQSIVCHGCLCNLVCSNCDDMVVCYLCGYDSCIELCCGSANGCRPFVDVPFCGSRRVHGGCCDDPDPCCGSSNRCCGGPEAPCCHSPDPCCEPGDPCCGNADRCCNSDNPCCESPDPCCNTNDPCCGNADRCCNSDNPCCESPDPCCNTNDACCGNKDRCCNPDNPCCGSPDPCCNVNDPCCGSTDPCCNPDNPCCAAGEAVCCGTSDPCCNNPDACCGMDCDDGDGCTVDTCSGGSCMYEAVNCDDRNACTDDSCVDGACVNTAMNCDDGKECTEDVCVDGMCVHNDLSCLPCGVSGLCVNGGCVAKTCSFSISEGTVCPGGTVEVELSGRCEPDCWSMELLVSEQPDSGTATLEENGIVCDGVEHTVMIQVAMDADAPLGAQSFGVTETGDLCSAGGVVTVEQRVDLTFGDVPEDDELNPGGFLPVNDDDDDGDGVPDSDATSPTVGEDDLVPITVTADGTLVGTLTLEASAGGNRIRLYEWPDRSDPVALPISWALDGTPKTFQVTYYVEGIGASAAARDVSLELNFQGDGVVCTDEVRMTVYRVNVTTVDATDPHAVRINYHVQPTGVILENATFTAPGSAQNGTNPGTDFFFPYDQDYLVTGDNLIILEVMLDGTNYSVTTTATLTPSRAPPFGTEIEIALFRVALSDAVVTIPVNHSIYCIFSFVCYSEYTLPGSKTIWLQLVSVSVQTEESSRIPTQMTGWIELLNVHDDSGDLLQQIMADVTVPTTPPQSPYFQSKHADVYQYFRPGENLTVIGRISTMLFRDDSGTYLPLGLNVEVDLSLEENSLVNTDCR